MVRYHAAVKALLPGLNCIEAETVEGAMTQSEGDDKKESVGSRFRRRGLYVFCRTARSVNVCFYSTRQAATGREANFA